MVCGIGGVVCGIGGVASGLLLWRSEVVALSDASVC